MARHPLASLAFGQIKEAFGSPDYWHTETPVGRHVDLTSPRGYYLDYSRRADYPGRLDPHGVPVFGFEGGRAVYDPVDVSQFALGNLELYLATGSPERRDRFEAAADLLMRELEEVPGSFVGWPMAPGPRAYARELGSGWFSGMAHGECISVLVRAGTLFHLGGALDAARRAMGGFQVTVEDGGFLREIGDPGQESGLDSLAFIEEYPMTDRPSMVLSGHVHAMWGVFDYMTVTRDERAAALFDRCLRGLKSVLDGYDVGFWTRYDLDDGWPAVNLASPMYQWMHVRQMESLHRITGDDTFLDTARRWEAYALDRRSARKAYWAKMRFKVINLRWTLV